MCWSVYFLLNGTAASEPTISEEVEEKPAAAGAAAGAEGEEEEQQKVSVLLSIPLILINQVDPSCLKQAQMWERGDIVVMGCLFVILF